ncbi:MAG: AMP-binding protein, partial [Alphaproteobacteria bacterium]|nr:AMP-binding protein [Alphaproteobacteria bacterium]
MLEGCTPWPADFAARYRAAGYWRGITLVDLLHQAAARDPDKVALVFGAERLTYRALIEGADRLAVRLAELGLAPRDRVVFQLANSATFFLVFFALLRLGVIPVLALPAHRRAEIEHFFRFAEAKAYLIPDRHRDFDYRPLAEAVRATA